MSEHMAEPDTRERNPKVQMAWGLLAPYIASEDPPDLSDDDQAEILTAGALPQVWEIILELEQRVEGLTESRNHMRGIINHPLMGQRTRLDAIRRALAAEEA